MRTVKCVPTWGCAAARLRGAASARVLRPRGRNHPVLAVGVGESHMLANRNTHGCSCRECWLQKSVSSIFLSFIAARREARRERREVARCGG
jgi:hypothetical protein